MNAYYVIEEKDLDGNWHRKRGLYTMPCSAIYFATNGTDKGREWRVVEVVR